MFKAFPKRVSTPSCLQSFRIKSPNQNSRLLQYSVKDQSYNEIKSVLFPVTSSRDIKRHKSDEIKVASAGRYMSPRKTTKVEQTEEGIKGLSTDNPKSIAYYSFKVMGNDEFKDSIDKLFLKVRPSKLYYKRNSLAKDA